MASNMNRGYPVPPQAAVQGNAVPPAGPTPVPVPPPGPPPVPNQSGPPSAVPQGAGGPPIPPGAMGAVPPPGPGMRPPDRPMTLQHAGPPPSRQYGSPAPVYQPQPQRAGYPSGPMQGAPAPPPQGMHGRVGQGMGPPANTYAAGGRTPQGPMPSMGMESRKRPAPDRSDSRSQGPPSSKSSGPPPGSTTTSTSGPTTSSSSSSSSKKKKKLAEKILPQKVRDLVPESQAYMDLLTFERKLDSTIMRKRLDIQEALKRPMKQKRKLRIFISNTFYPGKPEGESEEPTVPSWELRVEGRLLDDPTAPKADQSKVKRKFSSFFKSLVIELDKDLYGPDNHLVEWHRTPTTTETDGFQVKRPGDKNVRCTILLLLDYQVCTAFEQNNEMFVYGQNFFKCFKQIFSKTRMKTTNIILSMMLFPDGIRGIWLAKCQVVVSLMGLRVELHLPG
ncbi:brahma-associated protein of 60 kDa-like [Stegodyphus dumicola]|uniref:brahma-associated protein of 60 kDa-like n=1 Tax=Stegodyphus dumicola TaxID=202533 RepID=UPI0015A7E8F1|nr:brahma-associated protein of 60 kDa-like [Stegodyphus dumicola]